MHRPAAAGARLLLCARRLEKLQELHPKLVEAGAAAVHEISLDVTNRASVASTLAAIPKEWSAIDVLVESGLYIVGSADEVAEKLVAFHEACGGFGTLLMTVGKDWATHDKRARSMRLFMEQVAPKLRALEPLQMAAE